MSKIKYSDDNGTTWKYYDIPLSVMYGIDGTALGQTLYCVAMDLQDSQTIIRSGKQTVDGIVCQGGDASEFMAKMLKPALNAITTPTTRAITIENWGGNLYWDLTTTPTTSMAITLPTPTHSEVEKLDLWLRSYAGGTITLTAPSSAMVSDMTTGFSSLSVGNTYTINTSESKIYHIECTAIGTSLIVVKQESTSAPPDSNNIGGGL